MNLRKITAKKSLKLLILMLAWMIVATASAAIYYNLTMQPQVFTSTPAIKFESAADTPSGSTVNDAWCLLKLKSYPNATLTYEQAVNISNTEGVPHGIKLSHVDITPISGNADVSNFTYINMTVWAQNGTYVGSFNYTTSGTTTWGLPTDWASYQYMQANEKWLVKVQTLSPADADTGIVANIVIAVDTQE